VWRVDDIVAVFDHLPARLRPVLITLTLDRRPWLNLGPGIAYEKAKERVRKVMSEVFGHTNGIWVRSIEPQTKTGEGWIHWHIIAGLPVEISDAEVHRRCVKSWRVMFEHVDQSTGELTRELMSLAHPDAIHVATERRKGAGTRYVAKYFTKAWPAVPVWMGESTQRYRKGACSDAFYDVLERIHRHVRARGGRRAPGGRKLRKRTLFQRMARSGSSWVGFKIDGGQRRFCGHIELPVVRADRLFRGYSAQVCSVTRAGSLELVMPHAAFRRARAERALYEDERDKYIVRTLEDLRAQWGAMQESAPGGEEGDTDAGLSGVA